MLIISLYILLYKCTQEETILVLPAGRLMKNSMKVIFFDVFVHLLYLVLVVSFSHQQITNLLVRECHNTYLLGGST